jgi:hypothetical protein
MQYRIQELSWKVGMPLSTMRYWPKDMAAVGRIKGMVHENHN